MTDLFTKKVTVYNDITAMDDVPRCFVRSVIESCQISGQLVDKANETIRNVINADTVITKDVARYKEPNEYISLDEAVRKNFYTVQAGDFIVFGEVNDVVSDAREFSQLQTRYKQNGIKVTSVNVNINGMAVDNITMTNA